MKHDRHHFVPFFAPLTTQKNEKNEEKKHLRYHHFTQVHQNS